MQFTCGWTKLECEWCYECVVKVCSNFFISVVKCRIFFFYDFCTDRCGLLFCILKLGSYCNKYFGFNVHWKVYDYNILNVFFLFYYFLMLWRHVSLEEKQHRTLRKVLVDFIFISGKLYLQYWITSIWLFMFSSLVLFQSKVKLIKISSYELYITLLFHSRPCIVSSISYAASIYLFLSFRLLY